MNSYELEKVKNFPKVVLGNWPTPIESMSIYDSKILIKRDDLSGYGLGGSKARKIEYLIGYLKSKKYDELITIAGNITNIVYDLISALALNQIKSSLLIIDDPPSPIKIRKKIYSRVTGNVKFMNKNRTRASLQLIAWYIKSKRNNFKPLIVLPSLSHPSTVIGNALGFLEMVEQCKKIGKIPSTIFVSVASGSMYAGFLLAEHLLREQGNPPITIVGVQVYPGPIKKWIIGMLFWTIRFLNFEMKIPSDRIILLPVEIEKGFARYSTTLSNLCESINSKYEFSIDPIFSGKSWYVMKRYLENRKSNSTILFWHCGYTPDWKIMPNLKLEGLS